MSASSSCSFSSSVVVVVCFLFVMLRYSLSSLSSLDSPSTSSGMSVSNRSFHMPGLSIFLAIFRNPHAVLKRYFFMRALNADLSVLPPCTMKS